LDDIDRSLVGSFITFNAGPLSPDDAWSRINELIAADVETGKLTGDQAADLYDLFAGASGPAVGGMGPACIAPLVQFDKVRVNLKAPACLIPT
jgi:hypothetical protein